MELDELLEDLQSVTQARTAPLPDLPGAYSEAYSSTSPQQLDDDQYTEVRHGPRYTPKTTQRGPSPPPAKPMRTDRPDYDSTVNIMSGRGGDYDTTRGKGVGGGGGGGLAELDNLLDMLSTTQETQPQASSSSSSSGRPTVAEFVNELTEVENQVSQQQQPPRPSQSPGVSPTFDARQPKPGRYTASAATKELDELMANLSGFKMPAAQQDDYAKTKQKTKSQAVNDLDSMLGSLQLDMNRQGVDTSAKGICAACEKPILGKIINAMKKAWHPEHFACSQCEQELGSVTFYEHNGKPYCEKDYHELFAPRCAYCNGPILDRCMRALDKTWHPEHFFCTLCGKHFGADGFHEKDSKAYCPECYYEKFAPRCKRCERAIMEGFVTALGSQWHPECFSCKICGVTFPRGDYYDLEGEPYCEIHYHAQRGTLCAQCQKPITGKCVSAMGKKFHPEHFTCAFCLKLLNKGTFKEHRSNAYCQPCYIKLFG